MDRAIFTSREFLILSLALNHSLTDLFSRGAPGYSKAELKLLQDKVHRLGIGGHRSDPPREETFTLRDETRPSGPWIYPRTA